MSEIKLVKRVKYSDDVWKALLEAGWGLQEALQFVNCIPDAEPVTSEWVWDDDAIDWGIGAYVCKRCHGRNDNINVGKQGNPYAWVGSQFCPKCGAKMKGANDETD